MPRVATAAILQYHDQKSQVTYCMQEQVRVSKTDRITLSPACKVTVLSSTSTGVLVYKTKLVPLRAHLLIWLSGYFLSVL